MLYGAQVISWKNERREELLFMSNKVKLSHSCKCLKYIVSESLSISRCYLLINMYGAYVFDLCLMALPECQNNLIYIIYCIMRHMFDASSYSL